LTRVDCGEEGGNKGQKRRESWTVRYIRNSHPKEEESEDSGTEE